MFSSDSRKNGLKGAEDTEKVGFPEYLAEVFPQTWGGKLFFSSLLGVPSRMIT